MTLRRRLGSFASGLHSRAAGCESTRENCELSVTLRKTRVTLISSDVQMSKNPAHRGPTDVQPASDLSLADTGALQLANEPI